VSDHVLGVSILLLSIIFLLDFCKCFDSGIFVFCLIISKKSEEYFDCALVCKISYRKKRHNKMGSDIKVEKKFGSMS
jgi:hypothetical protein